MTIVAIVALVGWAVTLGIAVWLWFKLLGWARVGKFGRIAIAYNRKVQLQAPLTEWYLWTRQLKDTESGRVVYRNGKVTVAIVRPVIPPGRIRSRLQKRQKAPAQAQSKSGTWAMKQD